jgi:hypothetical protein
MIHPALPSPLWRCRSLPCPAQIPVSSKPALKRCSARCKPDSQGVGVLRKATTRGRCAPRRALHCASAGSGEVLAEMKMDSTAIAAGLLHDAVEDTPATSEEIGALRRPGGAHRRGRHQDRQDQFANREDRQAENVRKMLLAMVSDVRVVLIKLADRLHNMRTLEHLKPERQEAIAQGDARYLRAAGAPAGHGQSARRAGRPGLPLHRSRELRAGVGGRGSAAH